MFNQVTLIGRLGQDPDLRYLADGTPVLTISVATDESYTDREGNKIERTEWHRVVVFQRRAEACATYLHKGSLVHVVGRLTTRKWQDSGGEDRYITEVRASKVQFLDRRPDSSEGARGRGNGPRDQDGDKRPVPTDDDLGPAFPSEASNMDDVPF